MSVTVSRTPRRTRQFWMDHVSQWQNSGLSKAAYCEQHSLNAGNFYNWSRATKTTERKSAKVKKRSDAAPLPETPLTFVPVKVEPAKPGMEVHFVHVVRAATDVALPSNLSAEQIRHWLTAIHQLHV